MRFLKVYYVWHACEYEMQCYAMQHNNSYRGFSETIMIKIIKKILKGLINNIIKKLFTYNLYDIEN